MTGTMQVSRVAIGNVTTVRIIVPREYQPLSEPVTHVGDPNFIPQQTTDADDPNGEAVLERVCGNLQTASSGGNSGLTVAELRTRICARAYEMLPDIHEHDIVAIGNHPFSVVDGKLMGHEQAEATRGPLELSLSGQNVVIWTSVQDFAIQINRAGGHRSKVPYDHCHKSYAHHPFYRTDHPFQALEPVDPDEPKIFRVAAGPVRPDAVPGHYKVTFAIGEQIVDPDLIIIP
jgi:hypothetical protein